MLNVSHTVKSFYSVWYFSKHGAGHSPGEFAQFEIKVVEQCLVHFFHSLHFDFENWLHEWWTDDDDEDDELLPSESKYSFSESWSTNIPSINSPTDKDFSARVAEKEAIYQGFLETSIGNTHTPDSEIILQSIVNHTEIVSITHEQPNSYALNNQWF